MTTPQPPTARDERLNVMQRAADAAGQAILPFFRTGLTVDTKASDRPFDPVTEGDRAGERAIRDLLAAHLPEDAVFGEEFGSIEPATPSGVRWIIDPIDGTRGFILGLPTWGTLIGVEKDGVPVMGLMDQPYVGERFYSDGEASYFCRPGTAPRPLRTCVASSSLAKAHLAATHPDIFAAGEEQAVFSAIRKRVRDTRFGTDCYAYCLLAAGFIDIVIEAGLQPYDVAALIPIIQNAGGCITTWDGAAAQSGGRIIATANATLHDMALAEIAVITGNG
jgi:histidinol phosphatase-like enzyme (inositol monophosphatase family)